MVSKSTHKRIVFGLIVVIILLLLLIWGINYIVYHTLRMGDTFIIGETKYTITEIRFTEHGRKVYNLSEPFLDVVRDFDDEVQRTKKIVEIAEQIESGTITIRPATKP